MYALLILLALHAASPDARAFLRCADVSRKVGVCYEGEAAINFVNGGYPSRISFVRGPGYGAVCQPGTAAACEVAPSIIDRRPTTWSIDQTAIQGSYRYCLMRRHVKGHLPIGCLTRADHLFFRRIDFEKDFGR